MIGAGDLSTIRRLATPTPDGTALGAVWFPRNVARRLDAVSQRSLGLGCALGLDVG